MPDGSTPITRPDAAAAAGRSGRVPVLAFLADGESETLLRQGLASLGPDELVVHRGGCAAAISALQRMAGPRVLVVDVSGEDQPISSLAALSEVVEPDVRVLVIGAQQDINLYRQLTRNFGVAEYLYKPLSAEVVAQHFGPFISNNAPAAAQLQGGRVLTITGARGGSGATTLAVNLAWYLADEVKRHTVLVDPDLQRGTAGMLLGVKAAGGLRIALETPERVDGLLIERIAQPAAERLAVIAAEEKFGEVPEVASGAPTSLLNALRQRYNYVVVDVPFGPLGWYRDLLDQARQRLLVMEPTLAGVREALRFLALPRGAQQVRQPLLVLNQLGAPGTMTRREVEDALGQRIDVVVPYLPRVVNPAATFGTPAAATRGSFRNAIRLIAREVAAAAGGGSERTAARGLLGRWTGRSR